MPALRQWCVNIRGHPVSKHHTGINQYLNSHNETKDDAYSYQSIPHALNIPDYLSFNDQGRIKLSEKSSVFNNTDKQLRSLCESKHIHAKSTL